MWEGRLTMRAEKGSNQRITGSIAKMFQERYNGDVEWIQSMLCLSNLNTYLHEHSSISFKYFKTFS